MLADSEISPWLKPNSTLVGGSLDVPCLGVGYVAVGEVELHGLGLVVEGQRPDEQGLSDAGCALIKAPSLDKMVNFTNRLLTRWPTTHELNYVHVPLAEASSPPPIDPGWYGPLAEMQLPPGVRFVAGFVHDKRSPEEHRRIMEILDTLRGAPVDVASSCGLGRRDRPTALSLLETTRELTES